MSKREWAMVIASVTSMVCLAALAYVVDHWILTSKLPGWVEVILFRSAQ